MAVSLKIINIVDPQLSDPYHCLSKIRNDCSIRVF